MADDTPGRILRVNLSTETVESEHVPRRWLRHFIGGKGLGARYLYEELDPDIDPLGPQNALLFMTGPLSGLLPGESRYAAVTKSPLTGTFLDSYCGGAFAATFAGALGSHLGVLVTGRADRPVVIELEDGDIELSAADDLWGMDADETCRQYPDADVACIGPAGERLVSYATIASDEADHHAGRGGSGAVLGSKHVKALVARGEPPDGIDALEAEYTTRYEDSDVGKWQAASETLETVDFANEVGVLSTRGWKEGTFEGADDIGIEAARAAAAERENDEDSIPGGFRIETEDGTYVPRGATAMSLGAGLGIDDFDAVSVLGHTCDRLGLDVISAGNVVAWAIRASEAGVIDRSFSFSDHESARILIEEIAARSSPLGDALADGVDTAATQYGGEELVPTVKAMELPAYDPRGATGMALAYATSDRGGCHRRARPVETEALRRSEWSDEDRVETVVEEQDTRSVLWSLIADDFTGDVLDDLGKKWLEAIGHPASDTEPQTAGERIWTVTRLFNVREGFGREDDELPEVFSTPLDGGPATGATIDATSFDTLLQQYYARREWSRDGIPTQSLLERLDLRDIVDDETPLAERPATHPGR
ncbi:aldehyde ferredoxin oxidoreductase family protein [Haladaptatus sp. NG-SE-30]